MKSVLVFLLAAAIPFCLKAQSLDEATLECQYKLTWVPDTLHPSQTKEDFMILKACLQVSEFYSYNTFRVDSAIQADIKKGMSAFEILGQRARYGRKGMEYHIFNNYPKGKITVTEKLLTDYYKYEEPLQQQWVVGHEQSIFMGYKVQNATCSFGGRKYVAWFTSEIPLSTGPWKFNGLPGLILKVEDIHKNYTFEIVGLHKVMGSQFIEMEPKAYISVSKRDFLKLDQKMKKDLVGFINSNTEMKVKSIENAQKKERPYNPIER